MTSAYQRVVEISIAVIKVSPDGVRFIDLKNRVLKEMPNLNENTLSGALNRFRNNLPEDILRPVRGLYITKTAWSNRDKKKLVPQRAPRNRQNSGRSEEHTSELQSLMRTSYAVFCLKKKKCTNAPPELHLTNQNKRNN